MDAHQGDQVEDDALRNALEAELYGNKPENEAIPSIEQVMQQSPHVYGARPNTSDLDLALYVNIGNHLVQNPSDYFGTYLNTSNLDPALDVDGGNRPVQNPSDGFGTSPGSPPKPFSDVPEIEDLYNNYRETFADFSTSKEQQMEYAKALAVALLERHFPGDQGYSVKPISLAMMAKNGWSFPLKDDQDIDPDHEQEPVMSGGNKTKDSKKRRKVSRSKKGAPFREFNVFSTKWHHVQPQHITGYVVQRRWTLKEADGTTRYEDFPHMCFGIMIDDLATFPRWNMSLATSLDRGDLLSFTLGVEAKIEKGYGVLLLGPRLEFYTYDNNAASPVTRFHSANWAYDMRHSAFEIVDSSIKQMAMRNVLYQNGITGPGVGK